MRVRWFFWQKSEYYICKKIRKKDFFYDDDMIIELRKS